MIKAISFAAVCLLTGCLARPRLDQTTFIFDPPPPSSPAASAGRRVLGIRSVQVAAPFEGRAFVYRTGAFSYEHDPYAAFMAPPAESLLSPIRRRWRQAGAFRDVAEAGSALKPDTLVEIHVAQLYGDFRPLEKPAAVLAIRFVFFDAPKGVPGKVILQREYSERLPLKTRTAAALMEAWNQALSRILDATAQELGQMGAHLPKP